MADEAPVPEAPAAAPAAAPAPAPAPAAPEVKVEAKVDVPTPEAPKAPEAPKTEAPKAPEKYEFAMPEGVVLNSAVSDKASAIFKKIGLSQDHAQEIVGELAPVIAAQHTEALQALDAQWKTTAEADKEYGGAALTENLGIASKALDQFCTPEFKAFLKESRLGNHPEMVRAFVRIGKAISEDKFVLGSKADATRLNGVSLEQRAASKLYPNARH